MITRMPVWVANQNSTRAPIVALGGGLEPLQTWQACARACAHHPFYVLGNPQWSAAATSESCGQPCLADYLFAIDHTLASLRLKDIILVGVGLLGEIALAYASVKSEVAGSFDLNSEGSLAPSKAKTHLYTDTNPVGGMILAGVSGNRPSLDQRTRWFEGAIHLLTQDKSRGVQIVKEYLQAGLSSQTLTTSACQHLLQRWASLTDRSAGADLLRIQSQRPGVRDRARNLRIPVTLLRAAHDPFVAGEDVEELARVLCTTVATIPDAGALIHIDQPGELARRIEQLSPFVA